MSALHVLFHVAGNDYAVPASEVLHMESFAGAVKVPGTRPYVAGIVQTRSRVVPVVDLRAASGLERARALGVQRIPAVAIDGALAPCCAANGLDSEALRATGFGRKAEDRE